MWPKTGLLLQSLLQLLWMSPAWTMMQLPTTTSSWSSEPPPVQWLLLLLGLLLLMSLLTMLLASWLARPMLV